MSYSISDLVNRNKGIIATHVRSALYSKDETELTKV